MDYTSISRSNYFRVKDIDAFETLIESYGRVDSFQRTVNPGDQKTYVSILWDDSVPAWVDNEETGELDEIDWSAIMKEHLEDGEVAIFMSVGSEGYRYLGGIAEAYRSDGERLIVTLDDIYEKVKKEWGVAPTEAVY